MLGGYLPHFDRDRAIFSFHFSRGAVSPIKILLGELPTRDLCRRLIAELGRVAFVWGQNVPGISTMSIFRAGRRFSAVGRWILQLR